VRSDRMCARGGASNSRARSFHAYNIGHLASRAGDALFSPCTPAACIRLLDAYKIPLAGAHAVVLGRSDIVGSPVAAMLRSRDATVTQCHSRTRGLPEIVKTADIVVAAIGKAEFVKGEWLKPGAVVIDVGINYVPGEPRGGRMACRHLTRAQTRRRRPASGSSATSTTRPPAPSRRTSRPCPAASAR
jgi:5,10-methylene-tetrahydrofolate dehydrogenase/methenyl tetrahydrofolate cyclohydrolase